MTSSQGCRIAFIVWAWVLSVLLGLTFVGVTGLMIDLWLADWNRETNPVTDLGFFALGGILLTT